MAAARSLLDMGSTRTVFARNEQLQTPMHSATLNGHIGVVEALLERWPDPNMMDFSASLCHHHHHHHHHRCIANTVVFTTKM